MRFSKLLLIAFFGAALAACSSGGTDDSLTGGAGGGATGGGGAGGGGGGGAVNDTITIGSGSGGSFVPGIIEVSQTMLPAGGSASITVTFVDQTNTLVSDSIMVTFTSTCAAGGLADIVESSITTTTGSATATYSATGCSGDDEIVATATVNGDNLRATNTVNVMQAAVGSINYISADPTNIGLLGTGGAGRQETSTVRFRVTDATGGPRPGSDVSFSLNTTVGGIALQPTTAVSDAQGFVQTVISAGAVATPVRVTATVVGSSPVIAAQSDQLTITTGIPDQNSVSLSTECPSIEGFNLDGVESATTIRLSDRFNNPVPDGTAVTFTSEGGQIGGSCLTTTTLTNGGGVCTVAFVSQQPRPANGRVEILASAIGEESFTDVDSNGRFNDNDIAENIGEPFQDNNENGLYDLGEPFRDFNQNGLRDDENQADYAGFNGLLCDAVGGAVCNPNETLFVSDSLTIVLSTSGAIITFPNAPPDPVTGFPTFTGNGQLLVNIQDGNGNPVAGGSRVEISATGATAMPTSFVIPCSNAIGGQTFSIAISANTGGAIRITVESPNGLQSTNSANLAP
ncbi:MAG: hypothetical protein AAFX44_02925 [Pseudomonadota bacterium]